jgi:uncharacterized phage infection (PIP) family protein YhgE
VAKSKATLSIDPQVWEQFKTETDSASQKIEELLQSYLSSRANDLQDLQNRRDELREKVQQQNDIISEAESRREQLKSEMKQVEAAIEDLESQNNRVQAAVENVIPTVKDKRGAAGVESMSEAVDRASRTESFHMNLNKIDLDVEDFKERILEEVKA